MTISYESHGATPVDTTPPAIACDAPDGSWHADNVSISCTASDAESGLAHTGDAAFELATSLAEGAETGSAATGSRQVCDNAGNCATAGPVGGNKVDRRRRRSRSPPTGS